MGKKSLLFYLCFVLFFVDQNAFCADPGTTIAPFLKIGVGARATGMGEAFTAVADDVDAIFWNPAGLPSLDKQQATYMRNAWGQDVYMDHFAYANPLGHYGVLGGSLNYLWLPSFEATSDNMPNGTGENLSVYNLAVTISYGYQFFPEHNLGINFKIIQMELGPYNATGWAIDLGYLYKPYLFPSLQLGATVENLGPDVQFISDLERLPLLSRWGAYYKLFKGDEHRLGLASDLVAGVEIDPYLSMGMEYWYKDTIALRLGYKAQEYSPGITLGIGLRNFEENFIAGIDYSFVNEDSQGLSGANRFSVISEF